MEEERAREDIVRRDASSLLEATRKRERGRCGVSRRTFKMHLGPQASAIKEENRIKGLVF